MLMIAQQVAWVLFAGFELTLLVVWTSIPAPWHRIGLASAVINFIGAVILGLLSFFEHLHTVQPSFLLNVYLLFTSVFDIARSRSYSLTPQLDLVATIFTTRLAVKVVLAFFEARGKRSVLLPEYSNCTTESTGGIYKSVSFWWLNQLFSKGFSSAIGIDDLFHLDEPLQADYLHQALETAWNQGRFPISNKLHFVTN